MCDHGTRNIDLRLYRPKNYRRVFWMAVVGAAVCGAAICGLSQLTRYQDQPLVVSVQKDYRNWWSTFPALTACFTSRMNETRANRLIEKYWNVTEEDDEKYQYYRSLVELVSDINFRTNVQSFWKYQNDPSVAEINLLEIAKAVHPDVQLKATTAMGHAVEWTPVITEMGLCRTFNSAYAKYQALSNPAQESIDLFRCHYNSRQCFVNVETDNEAVKFFIHSPYDIPDAVSNPVGPVEPGTEALVEFTLLEMEAGGRVKALAMEQRYCRYPDESLSDDIRVYSYGLCKTYCRSKMAVMFCGCRPFFHVGEVAPVCDSDGMACLGRNAEILINLPKNLARCSCLPQCTELNYYPHSKKIVSRRENESELLEEGGAKATLHLTLRAPNTRLHRDVIFTYQDLLASLGGTMALFVGASVLTVVDTCYFVCEIVCSLLIAAHKTWKKQRQ